ncbi:MAG: hypothetical protein ACYC7E_05780 [Armatimonadota bacterium]
MKKRFKYGGLLAFIAVMLVVLTVLAVPSIQQNIKIHTYFNDLFQAIQERDRAGVQKFYKAELLPAYLDQIMQYDLVGWKITGVTGQPWPLDRQAGAQYLTAKMYYLLPDTLVAPRGKYKRYTHPLEGPCAVVPVRLMFAEYLREPGYETGKYWTGPFLKKLQTPRPTPGPQ